MANSSVSTIIGYGLQAAKISDSTGVPGCETTALIRVVDRENRNFVEAPYAAKQSGWDFMINEFGFTVIAGTTSAGAVTTATTSFDITSATSWDSSNGGFVFYDTNIADYGFFGSRSSTTLSTVTKISFSHASGTPLYKLYALPSTFYRPRPEKFTGDGFTIDTVPYYYGGSGNPVGRNFSVLADASGNSFVWVPRDVTGTAFMRYESAAATLDEVTDTVDVPVRYEEYLIQKVAAHVMRVLSKDANKILEADAIAMSYLRKAFAERSITKRFSLARRPIRSYTGIESNHFMDSAGNIY